MELERVYREVANRLGKLDFAALWPGFRPLKFALYDEERCFFHGAYVPKTEEFLANTSIPYQGEQIAIWQLAEEDPDPDRLAASIAHEMFHAFQTISGECRWADERAALRSYRYLPENLGLKLREAELTERLLEAGEAETLPELLALRRRRWETFPGEYDYEARIEQIEGTASFVELEALSRLAPEKGRAGWRKLLDRLKAPENYTPIRVISYDAGAALLACLSRYSDFDFHPFAQVPFAVAALEGVSPAAGELSPDPRAEAVIAAYGRETERIVRAALEKGEVVLEGAYPLMSLNIWDARWDGRYAVSSHFVAWWEGKEPRSLEGDFVVELDEANVIRRVYRQ